MTGVVFKNIRETFGKDMVAVHSLDLRLHGMEIGAME